MRLRHLTPICCLALLAGCAPSGTNKSAKEFTDDAEKHLLELINEAGQAQWLEATYINVDSQAVAASANARVLNAAVAYAKEAATYDASKEPAGVARKLHILKTGLTLAPPADPALSAEATRLDSSMKAAYGSAKYCPDTDPSKCLNIDDITKIMASSRDPKTLLDVWTGWHSIGKPLRKDYQRFVEISNAGAKGLGFDDTGAMWRSKYDMPPADFAKEADRLWEQVKPLYMKLHAYARWKLRETYGPAIVPEKGPIPAHLLGDIWAQGWVNIYPLLAPGAADPGYDLTTILRQRKTDPLQMVRYGENFFTSLGFAPLPKTFWERSMFTRPRDRDVVCHASAWDVDNADDLRIKMCIEITEDDFNTVHHELGHSFYQRAYNKQPFLFRDSANDGFHEAVGDTVALSLTPAYLKQIGLLTTVPDASKDIGLLLRRALDKVAFLPFGLLVDQWRWRVFSGEIQPGDYNRSWWELRTRYQGVAEPNKRTEDDFDPGAKYHIAGNVPYTSYFLAHILQFQFHKALAETAGCKDALHRCSIYANKNAGNRLSETLEQGLSKPWPDAMEKLAGTRQMDGSAIRAYFAPLEAWLDEQNKGKPIGW